MIQISIVVFFICLILFFLTRLAETSFIRIPSGFLDDIEGKPSPADYRVDHYIDHPALILVATSLIKYIIVPLVIIASIIIVRPWLIDFSRLTMILLSSLFGFMFIYIFGEIFPLFFKKKDPISVFKATGFVIFPFASIISIFRPVLPLSFNRYENRLPRKDNISISEISDAIENSDDQLEEQAEKNLIMSVIKFSDLEVKEVMHARMDVVTIPYNSSFSDVSKTILDAGYSRFPVYGNSLDDIKGILYIKDVLPEMNLNADYNWQQKIRPAFFVPENLKITQLLREFQLKKQHMAVIVDEYGGTSGIATLEDVIEEIVGEINDESDTEKDEVFFQQIDDKSYVFDAKIQLNDLCKITGIDSDVFEQFEGEAETLAGVILAIVGHFPERKQIVAFGKMEFVIEAVDRRRIKTVRINLIEDDENS